METGRGRRFLEEYARRNRHADTQLVLDAIGRIEALIKSEQAHYANQGLRVGLLEMARAIALTRADVAESRHEAAHHGDTAASKAAGVDVFAAAERLQDVAWTMRERGLDMAICDQIQELSSAILSASALRNPNDGRARKLGEVLRYLEQRIDSMLNAADRGSESATAEPVATWANHESQAAPVRNGYAPGDSEIAPAGNPPAAAAVEPVTPAEVAPPDEPQDAPVLVADEQPVILADATEPETAAIVEAATPAPQDEPRDGPIHVADEQPAVLADATEAETAIVEAAPPDQLQDAPALVADEQPVLADAAEPETAAIVETTPAPAETAPAPPNQPQDAPVLVADEQPEVVASTIEALPVEDASEPSAQAEPDALVSDTIAAGLHIETEEIDADLLFVASIETSADATDDAPEAERDTIFADQEPPAADILDELAAPEPQQAAETPARVDTAEETEPADFLLEPPSMPQQSVAPAGAVVALDSSPPANGGHGPAVQPPWYANRLAPEPAKPAVVPTPPSQPAAAQAAASDPFTSVRAMSAAERIALFT